MSKVIMMCGVCGSGKTTYAKKKEQEGYIRLSIDEEMWKLYGRKGIDYPEEEYEKLSEQVEAALQKKLLSLIQQGKQDSPKEVTEEGIVMLVKPEHSKKQSLPKEITEEGIVMLVKPEQ